MITSHYCVSCGNKVTESKSTKLSAKGLCQNCRTKKGRNSLVSSGFDTYSGSKLPVSYDQIRKR
jgi:hypothetical protein